MNFGWLRAIQIFHLLLPSKLESGNIQYLNFPWVGHHIQLLALGWKVYILEKKNRLLKVCEDTLHFNKIKILCFMEQNIWNFRLSVLKWARKVFMYTYIVLKNHFISVLKSLITWIWECCTKDIHLWYEPQAVSESACVRKQPVKSCIFKFTLQYSRLKNAIAFLCEFISGAS